MASTPSVTTSQSIQGWPYDVFLSFRGDDTRKTFVDHLYYWLEKEGVHTFKDDNRLEKGECIAPSLLNGIQESRFFIPIFSKGYASSKWCLEELATIMERQEKLEEKIVVPIFYHVEPSDVRNQKGSFEASFKELEQMFKDDEEKIRRWKEALKKAGNLKGHHLQNDYNGYEGQCVEKVTADILARLNRSNEASLDHEKNLFGMESRVDSIGDMLRLKCSDIRFIGIYGMGGIGKTTIAWAVFNKFSRQFGGACFLENISSKKGKIIKLQMTLLKTILKPSSAVDIRNEDEGIKMIKRRLWGKKVLIVLDDVDNRLEQLEKLAGGHDWFGEGSRVIITTRDRGVLRSHGVDEKYIYEVNTLEDEEAIQLFSWYAFRKKFPDSAYDELSQSIVRYAMGLPLALKVLGSSLCGLEVDEWKSTLKQLKDTPHDDIDARLNISFERLDPRNREMFLDIACFFRNWREEDVKNVLNVRLLIEKCLISVKNGKIEMHDLIQKMGWRIARQEKPRKRVWQLEDVNDVLMGNLESNHIKGILFPSTDEWNNDENNIELAIEAFKHMKNLEILIVDGDVKIFHDSICSSKLRWLHFKNYGFTSFQITKNFDKLAYLGLSESYSLSESPDFARMPNLKRINLSYCPKLKDIHLSVGNLRSLVSLDLRGCSDLEKLPSFNQVSSLKFLDLQYCQNLKFFPEIKTSMKYLVELDLEEVCIEELPSSIQQLHGLTKLCLIRCKNLVRISNGLCKLEKLKVLKITCCSKIESSLPLNGLTSLEYLNLQGSGFTNLPRSLRYLCRNLQYLDITSCRNLIELPELPASMKELYVDCHFGFGSNIFELAIKCLELYSISFYCEDQFEVGTSLAMKFIPFPLNRKNPFSFSYPIPKADILRSFKYRRYGAHNGISINLSNSWYSENFWGFAICFRPLSGDMWRPHSYQEIDGHMEHCVILAKLSHKDNKSSVLQRECVIVGSKDLGFYIDGHMCFVNIPFTSLWDGSKTTMDSVTPNDYSRFEVAFVNLEASAYYWGCSLLYHERKENKRKKCISISRVSCEALEKEVSHEIRINGLQVPQNVCTLVPTMGSITCIGSNTCITLVQIEDYTNFMWTSLSSWDGNLPGGLTTKIGHLTECISRLDHYHYRDCSNDFRRCEKKHQLPPNIRELYACHTLASENNIAELATKYSELYSVSFSHGVVTLSAAELAKKFSLITELLLNRNTPFTVTYTTTNNKADINMRCFKYSSPAPNKAFFIDLDPTWYNKNFVGFVVCFLFSGREIWESDADIHPFRHCEIIAKLAHKDDGNKVLQKKCIIGRLYNEEFDFTFGDWRLICFAYIPFSSLKNESESIMDTVNPNDYSIFEVTFPDLEVSTDWSCDLIYTTEAIRRKWEQEHADSSDLGIHRTKLWQLTKILYLPRSKLVSIYNKKVQLLYTNSGIGILALSSNGILKLWKCFHDDQNPSGKHWQPQTMIDNEEAIPLMALSKDDSYVLTAIDKNISLFSIMEFKVMKTLKRLQSASTFIAFHPHDNYTIAIGMEDSTIYIWDVRDDKAKSSLQGHLKRITGLAFSTNRNILVSSGADARLCVWSIDTWQQRISVVIRFRSGKVHGGDTQVMFHDDQVRLLVTHETQLAIYDTSKMFRERIQRWIPRGSLSAPISSATYSCNSQLVYASFIDGNIGVFDADTLRLRCHIAPSTYLSQVVTNRSEAAFPVVVAAHPQEPIQFAVGFTNGSVKVIELLSSEVKLLKSKVKWEVSLPVDNDVLNDILAEDRHGFGEVIFDDDVDSDDEVSNEEESDEEFPIEEHDQELHIRERLPKYSEGVAADILARLNQASRTLVGLESIVNNIGNLLKLVPENILRSPFIGICGMGGIGKTTIARAVFNKFSSQYDEVCFLEDVRQHTVIELKETLITNLVKEKSPVKIRNELYRMDIMRMLHGKKVLIVLDDVDDAKQTKNLVGDSKDDWLGEGSRVIITTRDMEVLHSHRIHKEYIYEVQTLGEQEAIQLFSWYAFKKKIPKAGFKNLCGSIVRYAMGLPLCLKVLGSHLCGLNALDWETTLVKLQDADSLHTPKDKILEVLKISFDGLDPDNKNVFLDIACFLRDWREEDIKDVLGSDLCVLIEKSLISVQNGRIKMHDQIQEMGRHIASQEKPRRRVWEYKDFDDVLSGKMDPKHIEGCLFPSTDNFDEDNVRRAFERFKGMENLKILKFQGYRPNYYGAKRFHFLDVDSCLHSSELRWYDFPYYPFTSLPESFKPSKLVGLFLQFSLLENCRIIQKLDTLTYLDLSDSHSLLETPDFDWIPNLMRLTLTGCTKLKEIKPSIGNLRKLVLLDLGKCSNLQKLPNFNQVSSLRSLNLLSCVKLENFPEIKARTPDLVELVLEKVGIKELPSSIQQLHGLTKLCLVQCPHLVSLCNALCELKNLKVLEIKHCRNLKLLPENLEGLISLECLILQRSCFDSEIPNKLPKLPANIKELYTDCPFKIADLAIQCSKLYLVSFSNGGLQYGFLTSLAKRFIHFPLHRETPLCLNYIPDREIHLIRDEKNRMLRTFKYRSFQSNGIFINLDISWYSQKFVGFVVSICRRYFYEDIDHTMVIAKLSHKNKKNEVCQPDCEIAVSTLGKFDVCRTVCFAYIPVRSFCPELKGIMNYSRFEVQFVNLKASADWGCSLLYERHAGGREHIAGSDLGFMTTDDTGCLSLLGLEPEYLNLNRRDFTRLPKRYSQLSHLRYLDISGCRRLIMLPKLPATIRELYANSNLASESNIAKLATKYSELYSVSFSHGYVTLSAEELARKFVHVPFQIRNSPFIVTYPAYDDLTDIDTKRWFKYSSDDPSNKVSINLDSSWYSQTFVGFVVCFLLEGGQHSWESHPDIRPFKYCKVIAKLIHKDYKGNEVQTNCVIGRLYEEEFVFTKDRIICFAYIPLISLSSVNPDDYSVFEVAFLDPNAKSYWSCGLLYKNDESLSEAIRSNASASDNDSGQHRTIPWQLTEIVDPIQCQMVTMPDCSDAKVAGLIYTKRGGGILALSSDGILKMWEWSPGTDEYPERKATANSAPQHWQTNSGLLMINDVSGVNLEKVVPCITSAYFNYGGYRVALAAASGRVSIFIMKKFEEKTTFMCPSAPTFLAFDSCVEPKIIAIGMEDSTIYLYNFRKKEVCAKFKGHKKRVTGLAFSTNPYMLVSSGADAQICVWNIIGRWKKRIAIRIQLRTCEVLSGDTQVMFHADQIHLLVAHETQLAVYDASKMERISQWIPHGSLSAPISSATYSCNSLLVYASFIDGNIGVLDTHSLRLRCRIAPSAYLSQTVSDRSLGVYPIVIAAHPEKTNQFTVGLTNGSVKVIEPLEFEKQWGVSPPIDNEHSDDEEGSMTEDIDEEASMSEDSDEEAPMTKDNDEVTLVIEASDQKVSMTQESEQELGQGRIKHWQLTEIVDLNQCRMLSMPECSDAKVTQLLYTKCGVGILAFSSNGIQKLWKWSHDQQNPSGKATVKSFPQRWQTNSGLMVNDVSGVTLEKVVPCIAHSNNQCFVVLAAGERAWLFNIETFKVNMLSTCLFEAITFLACHPLDNIIVIGTEDSIIYIYNTYTNPYIYNMQHTHTLRGHQKRITGLVFSINLKMLVSSSADAQLCVWSTHTWEKRIAVPVQLPTGEVLSGDTQVMFHVDGLHLLVTHETQLAVYDASKMEQIRQWIPHGSLSAPISSATYSCDSQLVYASFKDGNIGVLDAASLRLRCRIAPSAYLSQAISNGSQGVYPAVIAAHPQEPSQLAVGLTNGSVKVIEPLEFIGNQEVSPPANNEILTGRSVGVITVENERKQKKRKRSSVFFHGEQS